MNTNPARQSAINVLTGLAGHILASRRWRRTERLIAGLSTRQVEDIGFERDWDGSVYRPADQA